MYAHARMSRPRDGLLLAAALASGAAALAYELLWNFVRTLSRRLRATNDKMTFLATTSKF